MLFEIVLKLEEITVTDPNQYDQIKEEQRKETQVFNNNNQSEVFKVDVEADKFVDVTQMCSFKTGQKRTYQESTATDKPLTPILPDETMKRKKGENGEMIEQNRETNESTD